MNDNKGKIKMKNKIKRNSIKNLLKKERSDNNGI